MRDQQVSGYHKNEYVNSEADHVTSENRGRKSGMKGTANSSYLSYIVEKDRPRQAAMGKS